MNKFSELILSLNLIIFLSIPIYSGSPLKVKCKIFMRGLTEKLYIIVTEPKDFQWLGKPLGSNYWKHFRRTNITDNFSWVPRKSETLEVITPEVRKLMLEKYANKHAENIEINPNSPVEEKLLKKSFADIPYETGQFRAKLSNGEVISESSIFSGGLMDIKTYRLRFLQFISKLKLLGHWKNVSEIESLHVHPHYEFVNISRGMPWVSPISPDDIFEDSSIAAEYLGKRILKSKVILPNGYYYQSTYDNSKPWKPQNPNHGNNTVAQMLERDYDQSPLNDKLLSIPTKILIDEFKKAEGELKNLFRGELIRRKINIKLIENQILKST